MMMPSASASVRRRSFSPRASSSFDWNPRISASESAIATVICSRKFLSQPAAEAMLVRLPCHLARFAFGCARELQLVERLGARGIGERLERVDRALTEERERGFVLGVLESHLAGD